MLEALTRGEDTLAHRGRFFGLAVLQLDCAWSRHGDDEIEAVEQCARQLVSIAREPLRRARALDVRIPARTARTQVHRPDELKARGKLHVSGRAGNTDDAVLQRLTKSFQRGALELRQLVQQQNAPVRETRLAWTKPRAAADDRSGRRTVVRRAKRRLRDEGMVGVEQSRDGMDPRDLECFILCERRQDAGEATGEHRLPGPRRTTE